MYYKPNFILVRIEMNELGFSPKKKGFDNGKADRSFTKVAQDKNLLWYISLADYEKKVNFSRVYL